MAEAEALVCMRCGAALDAGAASDEDRRLTCEACGTIHAHEPEPDAASLAQPRLLNVGDPVLAEWGGRWWRGELVAQASSEPERWRVRYLGWSDEHARELGRDRLVDLAGGAPVRRWKLVLAIVGLALLGAVAVLLANKGKLVASDAMVPVDASTELRVGQAVEVERDGKWVAGEILAVNEDQSVRVRYLDLGPAGDESVPRARLRLP